MATIDSSPLMDLAPFRIAPSFVERVWGSQDLRPWYERPTETKPIGEVWLTGDDCLVESGPYSGQTLSSVFHQEARALLGQGADANSSPLLLKVIFAKEKLSVQVHPNDAMAQKYGQPRGKTECWYALAAEPGAQVACGWKAGMTLDRIKQGIAAETLEESLNMLPVAEGDVIFVDAGTVHAIWPGSILLETQQNCDLTYRMYDYGRARELHVEKSLEAVRLTTQAGKIAAKVLADRTILVDADYFCVERIAVMGSCDSASLVGAGETAHGLAYLFAAAGAGRIAGDGFDAIDLPARGVVAIPASSPQFEIEDRGGLDLIRITPRWPKSAS